MEGRHEGGRKEIKEETDKRMEGKNGKKNGRNVAGEQHSGCFL